MTDAIDPKVRADIVALVGEDRMPGFDAMLRGRIEGLGDLAACARGEPAPLAEMHKAVSEAGMLGYVPLSHALRDLEHAVKGGTDTTEATAAAVRAMADTLLAMDGTHGS